MKISNQVLLAISFLVLVSCSNDQLKDPWPGVSKPQFNTQSFQNDSFNLSSSFALEKIDRTTSIRIDAKCLNKENNKELTEQTYFDQNKVPEVISVAEVMPSLVVLKPEIFSSCSFSITASNHLGSSQVFKIKEQKLDADLLPHQKLIFNINHKPFDLKNNNTLDQSSIIDFFATDYSKSPVYLYCLDLKVKTFVSDLSFESIFKTARRPLQSCRLIIRNDDLLFQVGPTFNIKLNSPRPETLVSSFLPFSNQNLFYSSSRNIEKHLLRLVLNNPHSFSIYLRLKSHTSNQHPIYISTPFYEPRHRYESLIQNAHAKVFWTSNSHSINTSSIIELKHNQTLSLDLHLKTDFLCRYNKIRGQRLRTGEHAYYEDGYLVMIKKEDSIAQLEQLQKNQDGSYTVIETDTLLNANNNYPFISRRARDYNENNFLESFFIREIDFKRAEGTTPEELYLKSPTAAYEMDQLGGPAMIHANEEKTENRSCVIF